MVEKSHTSGFWPSLYDPLRNMGARIADWFAPASEASVGDDGYRIALELPGVEDKDVTVTVENGVVTVTGEKRSERSEKGDSWYFSERQFGSFSRSFRLPPDAAEDQVKADLKEGVLTIAIARKSPQAAAAGKQVPIGRG